MEPQRRSVTVLVGGGRDAQTARAAGAALLAAAPASPARVACVALDDGGAAEQLERWTGALRAAGPCEPRPVVVPLGGRLDVAALHDADAVLVCGGLTPAYADALAPAAEELRRWLDVGGRAYAGYSAGAAVAAHRAVVGGWRHRGVQVCPDDAGEDLDEVTVVDGLGLVPYAVEVHCAQWGTLPRLLAAVEATPGLAGIALDEGAVLTDDGATVSVTGSGCARLVTGGPAGALVRTLQPDRGEARPRSG